MKDNKNFKLKTFLRAGERENDKKDFDCLDSFEVFLVFRFTTKLKLTLALTETFQANSRNNVILIGLIMVEAFKLALPNRLFRFVGKLFLSTRVTNARNVLRHKLIRDIENLITQFHH
jgi:hypothetical protein